MPKGSFLKRVMRGGEKQPRQESPSRPIAAKSDNPLLAGSRDSEIHLDPADPVIQSSYKAAAQFETSDSSLSQKISAAPTTITTESPSGTTTSMLQQPQSRTTTNHRTNDSRYLLLTVSQHAAEFGPPAIGDAAESVSIAPREALTSETTSAAAFAPLHQPAPHWGEASPSGASIEGSEASYTSSAGKAVPIHASSMGNHRHATHSMTCQLSMSHAGPWLRLCPPPEGKLQHLTPTAQRACAQYAHGAATRHFLWEACKQQQRISDCI